MSRRLLALEVVESSTPPAVARGIVIVAVGAGGSQWSTQELANVVDRAGQPIYVRSFDWTHRTGFAPGLADLRDVAHSRHQGQELASQVRRYQAAHPGTPITLVGFSSGSAVVLAAAESLPPDSLERIILLAPAVSACYDLRPALVASRSGIDAFTSLRDRYWLGLGVALAGTADGRRHPAAGRIGFTHVGGAGWAGQVRQHPWSPDLAWTGHDGSHGGSGHPTFVETFLLPLLLPSGSAGASPSPGSAGASPSPGSAGASPSRGSAGAVCPLRGDFFTGSQGRGRASSPALSALFWLLVLAVACTLGWVIEIVLASLPLCWPPWSTAKRTNPKQISRLSLGIAVQR